MKKFVGGWLIVLGLAVVAAAAERLKISSPVGEENLEYFKHNGGGRLLEWAYPAYPAEPRADWSEETVRVAFVVDATGAVSEARALSGPERFRGPALAAVRQFKFQPAIVNDQPTAVAREIVLPFVPTGTPAKSIKEDYNLTKVRSPERTPAGDPPNSDPIYPGFLESRRLSGDVDLLVGLDATGRVNGVKINRAAHPDLLSAALETVAKWECRPAREGLLAVPAQKGVTLSFYTTDETGRDNRADWMERNGIFLREPAGRKIVDYFQDPVEAVRMVDPVYPYELALAGTRGGARVNFRIDAFGRVGEVAVVEATHPEFGDSLAAAITAWQFRPLRKFDEVVTGLFSITWRFEEPRAGSEEQRLLAATGDDRPGSARGLDRPLFPLFQRSAVFPPDRFDAGEGGRAEIEFVIDRTGRVRLPRIRGASQPSFGWAAATALSQWLFETPLKNGQPVDVRVVVPMEFAPPDPSERPADAIKAPVLDPIAPPVTSVP